MWRRILWLWRRDREEQDLDEELRAHLAIEAGQRMESGVGAEEAHFAARRALGNPTQIMETTREVWRIAWLEDLGQDLRYALRILRNKPAFSAAAILSLALAIGANTSVFSIVNAILLRPLPYPNADRLVRIVENIPADESFSGSPERTTSLNPTTFLDWRSKTTTLSGMSLEMPVSLTLTGRQAVRLSGRKVSPALFPMLGVRPALGRIFASREETPGSDQVIILSYSAWLKYFGANPNILGAALTLNDGFFTVVGIMPQGFVYPDPLVEFWIPLALPLHEQVLGLQVLGRLRDHISMKAATAEAAVIGRQLRGESPDDPQQPGPPRIQLMSVQDELVAPIRLPLIIFIVAVAFVLFVGCINVANLFLAHAATRNREIAIRRALGAGRTRVFRQLLTENLLFASLGGIGGAGLAFWGTRLFTAIGESPGRLDLRRFELAGNAIPRLNEVAVDGQVLSFAIVLAIGIGVIFGCIPAVQHRRTRPIHGMELRSTAASMLIFRSLRTALVIAQVALTTVLLLGAGLLIKSFAKLVRTDVGYDPINVVTFQIPQPELSFPADVPKQVQRNIFNHEVVRRLAFIPGVEAAAFTNVLPMVQMSLTLGVSSAGYSSVREADYDTVSPDYFRVMKLQVMQGRDLDSSDRTGSRPAYVVNETLSRMLFPNASAVGQTITIGPRMAPGEIVGVVRDARQWGLDAQPRPCLFVDPEHTIGVVGTTQGGVYYTFRTKRKVNAVVPQIRKVVSDLDSNLVVDNVATMDQIISNSITAPRSYAALLGAFSVAALGLVTIGIFGLLAYLVKQRRQEIGIRLALGSEGWRILMLVLRQGLSLGILGLTIGLAGGVALTRYLGNMLFGVAPLDWPTFMIIAALVMVATGLASYLPARQAVAVDPVVTLRCD